MSPLQPCPQNSPHVQPLLQGPETMLSPTQLTRMCVGPGKCCANLVLHLYTCTHLTTLGTIDQNPTLLQHHKPSRTTPRVFPPNQTMFHPCTPSRPCTLIVLFLTSHTLPPLSRLLTPHIPRLSLAALEHTQTPCHTFLSHLTLCMCILHTCRREHF